MICKVYLIRDIYNASCSAFFTQRMRPKPGGTIGDFSCGLILDKGRRCKCIVVYGILQ